MVRLHILTEGPTEEGFVKGVLAGHLAPHNVFVFPRSIETREPKVRYTPHGPRVIPGARGGGRSYDLVRKDLIRWFVEVVDPQARFTSMIDLYSLPKGFPGSEQLQGTPDPYRKAEIVEKALADDLGDYRFIPYVQLHEFEALILAAPRHLDWQYLEHDAALAALEAEVAGQEPERINDGEHTAPSKRIIKHLAGYAYEKTQVGPLVVQRIVEEIGMAGLTARCPHFGQWIRQLESLSTG